MILKDEVIIVTGVGPSMGRKLCGEAALSGASVVVSARTADFVDTVVQEMRAEGGNAAAAYGDVARVDDCTRIATIAMEHFGRIDGLVNSVHRVGDLATFEDCDLDDWRTSFEVTLFGAFQMTKAVLPHMKAGGGGSIVNVGPMETRKPLATHGGASQGGVAGDYPPVGSGTGPI